MRAARAGLLAAVLVLAALAACSAGTLSQWVASSGVESNNAQLRSDIGDLENGIRLRELLPLRTACEAFSADASTADGVLPSPDTALTDELNTAYQDFYVAGADCFGAKSFASADYRRFLSRLAAGRAELGRASELLRRLLGRGGGG